MKKKLVCEQLAPRRVAGVTMMAPIHTPRLAQMEEAVKVDKMDGIGLLLLEAICLGKIHMLSLAKIQKKLSDRQKNT